MFIRNLILAAILALAFRPGTAFADPELDPLPRVQSGPKKLKALRLLTQKRRASCIAMRGAG
jgi:hypothetical protein